MADGGDIIIKGGSVDLDYDEDVYKKVAGKPKKHAAGNKRIRQITVTRNDAKPGDPPLYDSNDHPEGLDFTVSVFTK